jgi:hypothetical protein
MSLGFLKGISSGFKEKLEDGKSVSKVVSFLTVTPVQGWRFCYENRWWF